MHLFIFKPVILLKIVHFYLYIQKKVNITCNSWIISYPYPYYNFYQAFFKTNAAPSPPPPPPRLFSPIGGGAFANFALPGDRAFANSWLFPSF